MILCCSLPLLTEVHVIVTFEFGYWILVGWLLDSGRLVYPPTADRRHQNLETVKYVHHMHGHQSWPRKPASYPLTHEQYLDEIQYVSLTRSVFPRALPYSSFARSPCGAGEVASVSSPCVDFSDLLSIRLPLPVTGRSGVLLSAEGSRCTLC